MINGIQQKENLQWQHFYYIYNTYVSWKDVVIYKCINKCLLGYYDCS